MENYVWKSMTYRTKLKIRTNKAQQFQINSVYDFKKIFEVAKSENKKVDT